jgi:hypothetical protein
VLCFELERSIEDTIANLLLPALSGRSPPWLRRRYQDFHQDILSYFDLNKNIEIIHSMLKKRCPKRKDKISELYSILKQIKNLRNYMAHCPVYFQAIKKSKQSVMLKSLLETPKGFVHVTEGLITEYKKTLRKHQRS